MTKFPTFSKAQTRTLAVAAAAASLTLALSGCTPGVGAAGGPDPVGSWGTLDTTGVPYLTFTEDGLFSGSDGCNQLTGGWELDGSVVEFDNVATTLKACEGVDTWLSTLDTATISGDTMTIANDADKIVGTLDRVS